MIVIASEQVTGINSVSVIAFIGISRWPCRFPTPWRFADQGCPSARRQAFHIGFEIGVEQRRVLAGMVPEEQNAAHGLFQCKRPQADLL